uniref:Fluoride ion transporter CrcB n=1 Tax=Helicotheca tamesis TaxID=374047 RepID=A0A7S2GVB8_9STRA|mmetsp:Transcript_12462/g.17178  ORF Transcript_12462/g.17178 Transcript_12462/m.17178 type:complete len:177 (+) Transcript_12462:126-656(+)|eukprot:CAMPEP_0185740640 /NCGR_PEP_ID=MMETSP1171-20130828/38267_1 /TAXON_ID=374046 /ORGANISM="Helicotheca tamensis, Strain CCMP826" /LENGTH=176 /DNA_ID=CAMNT_0028412539 /DNA_START=71 /DNA_END=601 /DNA_ORIENTATION=+
MTAGPLTPFVSPLVTDCAAVGVGAVCGALARHNIGRIATDKIASNPERFSHLTGWHTAGINVLGSFVLGGVFGSPVIDPAAAVNSNKIPPPTSSAAASKATTNAVRQFGLTPRQKLMVGVGFCGSFTTFSTFSVDVVNMVGKGQMGKAAAYVMTNNVGGVAAAAMGMMVARRLFGC